MSEFRNNHSKTKIEIRKQTMLKLAKYGDITSTWDSVINEILDHIETCDKWWANK